jgi:DNA-directed RNA polymerase specialized sigma24 family protein
MCRGKSFPELSAHELPQEQADALFVEGSGRLTPSDEKRIMDSQLIRQAFKRARIDEQTTAIFLAKELQGKSVEEIADDIGMNENTIKVKLFRARQGLMQAANRLSVPRPPLAARTREIVA